MSHRPQGKPFIAITKIVNWTMHKYCPAQEGTWDCWYWAGGWAWIDNVSNETAQQSIEEADEVFFESNWSKDEPRNTLAILLDRQGEGNVFGSQGVRTMKASDLKPGQFFEFDIDKRKTRCRRTATGYEYIVEIPEEDFTEAPVTPLAVTGWDDEPQSEPAPLQLREGVEYVSRDGSYRTRVKPETKAGDFYKWGGDTKGYVYSDSGRIFEHREHPHDLIAEVPPPVEPVQFKAGDWLLNKVRHEKQVRLSPFKDMY